MGCIQSTEDRMTSNVPLKHPEDIVQTNECLNALLEDIQVNGLIVDKQEERLIHYGKPPSAKSLDGTCWLGFYNWRHKIQDCKSFQMHSERKNKKHGGKFDKSGKEDVMEAYHGIIHEKNIFQEDGHVSLYNIKVQPNDNPKSTVFRFIGEGSDQRWANKPVARGKFVEALPHCVKRIIGEYDEETGLISWAEKYENLEIADMTTEEHRPIAVMNRVAGLTMLLRQGYGRCIKGTAMNNYSDDDSNQAVVTLVEYLEKGAFSKSGDKNHRGGRVKKNKTAVQRWNSSESVAEETARHNIKVDKYVNMMNKVLNEENATAKLQEHHRKQQDELRKQLDIDDPRHPDYALHKREGEAGQHRIEEMDYGMKNYMGMKNRERYHDQKDRYQMYQMKKELAEAEAAADMQRKVDRDFFVRGGGNEAVLGHASAGHTERHKAEDFTRKEKAKDVKKMEDEYNERLEINRKKRGGFMATGN